MLLFLEVIDDADTRYYFNKLYEEYHQMMFLCALNILKISMMPKMLYSRSF